MLGHLLRNDWYLDLPSVEALILLELGHCCRRYRIYQTKLRETSGECGKILGKTIFMICILGFANDKQLPPLGRQRIPVTQ